MKSFQTFDVNGTVVDVPQDELQQFKDAATERGVTPNAVNLFRVNKEDGSSQDVTVLDSEMEDFKTKALDHKATFSPVKTLVMDDGTSHQMTIPELSRFIRSPEYRNTPDHQKSVQTIEDKSGSPTLAYLGGAVGGFFKGAWQGANAASNKIAKAIPEIGVNLESAAGHVANLGGLAKNPVGDWLVKDAAGAKAWMDEHLPSATQEWTGYQDWSTKTADKIGDVAAMAYKFAPGMATTAGTTLTERALASANDRLMNTIFASDGVNAFSAAYETATNEGFSPVQAAEAGGAAFLVNYFGGRAMLKAGGIVEGVRNPMLKFAGGAAAIGNTMGLQGAGNKGIENVASGKPIMEGIGEAYQEGQVEGLIFHSLNAVPGMVLRGLSNRAEQQRQNEMARELILESVDKPEGAAFLAKALDGNALDQAIQVRKAGAQVDPRLVEAMNLPANLSKSEVNRVVDAVSLQRQALAERVRTQMDDIQAAALNETIALKIDADLKSVGAEQAVSLEDAKNYFERTWLKAAEKVVDAKDLDNPEFRDKVVEAALKEAKGEITAERREKLQEISAIRGMDAAGQIAEIERREVASWDDAEAAGLVSKTADGKWTGGARQAVNIELNGTEKMRSAVKEGRVNGDLAEELLSLSYCELGNRPKLEREALVDRIIDQSDGNPETARQMMGELAGSWGTMPRPPETALEGAENAARMKGTELRSEDGALLGCEKFPDVKVRINQEGIFTTGLTDKLMSDPKNSADVAALLTRLDAISEKTGLPVNFGGDKNAEKVANDIVDAIEAQGLAKVQRKMDTRARLFDVLAKTTLDSGTTFTETEFKQALEKTGNGRRFVDAHGNIYGFRAPDGRLHFNPKAINFNTPIHEYGHLALEAVKKINPALWQKGMDLVKQHESFAEIQKLSEDPNHEYSYLKGKELDIADEALTTLIGNRGERLVSDKGLGAELKAWLKEFWQAFKGAFGVADISDAQIDKMTVGEFVDAINAELLRGREFGTKKAVPLAKKSIRRFDEDQNSGSNGILRWKNDRGYLFAIPVDMERTEPGGKVVLTRDDANITDFIQSKLDGYTLRLSKGGKVYVEGRDGLPSDLAEIFGRYPTIGQNDGIYEAIANKTGRPTEGMTPEKLVESLSADRASYDTWLSRRNAEADHYRLEAERDAAEARQRWENSGMNVVDYIRSRAEEGAPEFDMDWEVQRELARDRSQGAFSAGRGKDAAEPDGSKPSALGDGKQKYYEVPFDKAVEKIVNNKKPVSKDHVFISETSNPLKEIGIPELPMMMNQDHVISCYYGNGEGVKAADPHALKEKLKTLPSALQHPILIIASKTRPDDSIVSIIKMRDKNGDQIFVPVEINGIGRVGNGRIDANIVTSAYGRKNTWSKMVADAIRNEVDGKVSVFYLDNNEASKVSSLLAREAFDFGRAEVQFLRRSGKSNVIHTIADPGSPVKGEMPQAGSRQFKSWFGDSKIVDGEGKPLVVYHATNADFNVFDRSKGRKSMDINGFFFSPLKEDAEAYGSNVRQFYLSLKNPAPQDIAYEAIRRHKGENEAGVKALEDLERMGYDGVNNGNEEYIAFRPEQIKSATDNIGTFDPTNPDVRFHIGNGVPRINRRNFIAGRAMVAEDYRRGEQTPGALAASRELDQTRAAPISMYGQIRKMSLPLSELEQLRRMLTTDNIPAHLANRLPNGRASLHNRDGRLFMAADVLGMVDKTDAAAEKQTLLKHGFFKHEDPTWSANHSTSEIRAEKRRSDDQLANQLLRLSERRAAGQTPGGFAAARQVFADELASIVIDMPQRTVGVLGDVQTIGKGIRNEVNNLFAANSAASGGARASAQALRTEAGTFLDWAYGTPDANSGESLSVNELTGKMFGSWLVMPTEMETRAPHWAKAIESTIANTPKLAEAFRQLTVRSMTEQATGHLMDTIRRQQSLTTEKALKEIQSETEEPIKPGSRADKTKEGFFVALHDKFSPTYIRIDEKVRNYVKAKRATLAGIKDPAVRTAVRQEIDLFMGDISEKLNKLELSRTAYERGAWNEGRRYFLQMTNLENKAAKQWGISEQDRSDYLNLQRIIETQGRSASDGMSPRQASIALGNIARRLGAEKWQLLRQYGDEFFAIHEREVIDDPRLATAFGQGMVDYFKTQTHYVTTKRTLSEEQLAEIKAARAEAQRNGVAGGDNVISQMFEFAGKKGAGDVVGENVWTAKQHGSMAAKQEVRSATWEKVDPLMGFLRKNQMILDLRDALLASEVTGVRDLVRAEGGDYPNTRRYGHLNYMEHGQRRVLVVPKEISEAFTTDPDKAPILTKANNLFRKAIIDYNLAYTPVAIMRNFGSLEKNMPGMRETAITTALRPVLPGAAPLVDMTSQYLVRKIPVAGNLFGKHTYLFHLPKAERWTKIVENPSAWQQELWKAEQTGDAAKVVQMNDDFAGVMEMLKSNLFIPTHKAYGDSTTTHGFAFDALDRKGFKTLDMIEKERLSEGKWATLVNTINIFKKNQALNEREDVLTKTIGYLHDRMFYADQRSAAESGLMVKKNAANPESERSGHLTRGIQQFVSQFFNVAEKGEIRHWRNIRERPGETLIKDGKVVVGRLVASLIGYGVLQKFLLDDSDGDEEKAKAKHGQLYDYAKFMHRANQNCSQYVKDNYNYTPIWTSTDGNTTLIMGSVLNDEDRLIVPIADYVAQLIAHHQGLAKSPELGNTIAKSTYKAVVPDIQLASPVVTLFRDVFEAQFWKNPEDWFRGAPKYDPNVWTARNESWEMRGRFAADMGLLLWNDLGGRGFYQADYNGVDNGRGSAPETLETVLRKIPIVSPVIGRMLKIQVGSPEKQGEAILDERKKMDAVIDVCAKTLLKERKGEVYLHESDATGFEKRVEDWKQTYEMTDYDVAKLRQKYYNAWIQRANREGLDQKALQKIFTEAKKQGRDENATWVMLGDL